MGYVDYYDMYKSRHLSQEDQTKFSKIDDDLFNLYDLLSSSYYRNEMRTNGRMATINVQNTGETAIKNVRVNVEHFKAIEYASIYDYDYPLYQYMFARTDTVLDFSNLNEINIGNLLPGQTETIYISSIQFPLQGQEILLSYDGGGQMIYPLEKLTVTGKIDRLMTSLVVENRFIQILLYIIAPLGLIYLVFYIIPKMKRMFTRLRHKIWGLLSSIKRS